MNTNIMEKMKSEMFTAAKVGNLRTLQTVVNNRELNEEQRKELLNSVEENKETILFCAACRNQVSVITWLLSDEGRSMGFNSVLAKNQEGQTALHSAAMIGYLDSCKAIVNGCREDDGERYEMLNAVDDGGCTALHIAAQWSKTAIISWLLSNEEGGGCTLGFDRKNITALSKDWCTPLHYATKRFKIECVRALLSNCTSSERTSLLLRVDKNGWTVLFYAVRYNCSIIVTDLLQYPECQSIANIKDVAGLTVLHRAIIGGLDKANREAWDFFFKPEEILVSALLQSSSPITEATIIDPNIGIGHK